MARQEFICPITSDVMTDPVLSVVDGRTYERAAILDWLSRNGTSPFTRAPMSASDLVPNRALKDAIEAEMGATATRPDVRPAAAASGGDALGAVELSVSRKGRGVHKGAILSVVPPQNIPQNPIHLICVVDVSGSMGGAASRGRGDALENGLSRLDLVKHCLRTQVGLLSETDEFSLITFSDDATVCADKVSMSASGKERTNGVIEGLKPDDRTNLWAGVQRGLRAARASAKTPFVLVFTDGRPNISPPRGELEMLRRTMGQEETFTLSTFGFGYDVDFRLLDSMADWGHGSFSFISDCSMVGTSCVHFTSQILSAVHGNATVSFRFGGESGEWVTEPLGTVTMGQRRDIVLPASSSGASRVEVELRADGGKVVARSTLNLGEGAEEDIGDVDEVVYQLGRVAFIRGVQTAAAEKTAEGARKLIDDLRDFITSLVPSLLSRDARLWRFLKDMDPEARPEESHGQTHKACESDDWFDRWGRAYLLALARAHKNQECANFKDVSLQLYGGRHFADLRDAGEECFLSIPAPKPSIVPTRVTAPLQRVRGLSLSSAASSVDMRSYYDLSGGCFHGSGLVPLADKSLKPVADLRRGDILESGAVVACLVRVHFDSTPTLVRLSSGLVITKFHPVFDATKKSYVFPNSLVAESQASYITPETPPVLYDVFLDGPSSHSITVDGVKCVTLGHNIKDDPVAEHPYFGSKRVRDDLQKLPGFSRGTININASRFARDPSTNLITSYTL